MVKKRPLSPQIIIYFLVLGYGRWCSYDKECCGVPKLECNNEIISCDCKDGLHWNGFVCQVFPITTTTEASIAESKNETLVIVLSVSGGIILFTLCLVAVSVYNKKKIRYFFFINYCLFLRKK